jgi:hypothetical protein
MTCICGIVRTKARAQQHPMIVFPISNANICLRMSTGNDTKIARF